MPYFWVLAAVVALIVYPLVTRYRSLSRNIALAKASGLPFVVSPWNTFHTFWLATAPLWTPMIKKLLPASMQGLWVEYDFNRFHN